MSVSLSKWEKLELNEIFNISSKKFNPKVSNESKKCIEMEHLSQETGELLGFTDSSEQQSTKNMFKNGQVLYGKLRPYLKKYWKADFDGVCSSEIWVLDGKKVINDYLFQFVQTHKFNQVANVSSGSKMPRADWKYMAEIPFDIPPLKEQQKIAQILTTWDGAISQQEALIKAKEELKKGLMQKLLSGEVRFDGEWEEVRLDQVLFHEARPVDKPKEGYWRLGLRSHAKGTFHTFVEDPTTVSMDTLYVVKENDLIVNITFAWEHALALASKKDEGKLVSHRFPTYVFKSEYNPSFFKYYMLQPRFKYELVNISPGGAGRNRVMSKKDFLKLKVIVPTLAEQQKIAQVLTLTDKEIDLLKNELEALKEQKRGLMQKLLSGEVRVVV